MATLGTDSGAPSDAPPRPGPVPGRPQPQPGAHAEPTWFRRAFPLLALGLAAIVVTIVTRHLIYPAFSWNRDEATYLWQADALGMRQIFTTDAGTPDFFWPWLAGLRDGAFFPQYTVGWPLALLGADWLLGSPEWALSIGTVLTVLGTYVFARELTRDTTLALVSATIMLLSPIVVIQAGVYLAYLFALGLGLFFGAALLAGLRTRSPALLLTSGAILGWVLLTRPFDAVLWALPLGAYAVLVCWRQWRFLFRSACWVGAAFAPFVVFTLLYNHRVSGSFTTFPITAKHALDTFGFGPRQLMPIGEIFDYTLGRALRSTAYNLRVLPPFFIGSFVGVALAGLGLWFRWRERWVLALLGIMVAFPAGYFFFWGNLLSSRAAKLSGPLYSVPLYAPLCIFTAAALLTLWRRRRGVAIATTALLLVVTAPVMIAKIDPNHTISAAQEPWKDATQSITGDALVIVENSGPYLMHLNPYSQNTPDIGGKIVFAVDRGADNLDLIARYPGRRVYFERTTDPRWDDPVAYHDAPIPEVSLVPSNVVTGKTFTFRVQITNPRDDTVVVATLDVGGRAEQRVLATDASRGDVFETTWTLDAATLPERLGLVTVSTGTGSTAQAASAGRRIAQQYSYRLESGSIQVLTPPRDFVVRTVDGTDQLRQVPAVKHLDVELTANL